ncbi:MAG TPA: hypothetical protein VG937_35180 [Polyangiaceae bacterium]|nr:hypothetical protein [Polyangiaceae bacterium]
MIRGLSPFLALSSVAAFLVACASHPGVETQKLPDGTLRIKCEGSLVQCLSRADDLCHGNTYEVVRARDQRDRYGPELGTAQVEVRSSEAFIRCGSHGRPLGGYDELKITPAASGPAPSAAPATARAPVPPPAPPPPQRACVPGATQACIGPGKCEGGQSCLPDGSAFGPCDCGTLGPPVMAPAAPGAAPPAPSPTVPGSPGGPPPPPPAPTYKPQTPAAQPLKTPAPTAPQKH